MSSDQPRGEGFLSPSGQRKRSRTSFGRLESRSVPGNHTRRQHLDRSSASGRSNSNSRNNTPPSAKSTRSIGCRDEFLEDVHFDVVPKDMSIAASQEVARGDDSVVLQQLCSLGSVLAGGKCDTVTAADQEAGSYQCSRNGGHRGTSRNGSTSGGNLLTRWLKPATTFSGQGAKSRDTDQNTVTCETFPKDADVAQKLNGNGSTGGRAVGDLAKKALLRRKMVDAERGRRLRLQRESSSSTSTSYHLCSSDTSELALVHPESTNPPTSCIAESEGGPAIAMDVTERPSPQVSSNKTAGPPRLPANPDGSSGSAEPATAVAVPTSSTSGIVENEDEYGDDDFSFLTDADFQALEEDATRKSAAIAAEATASSQWASQQSVRETPSADAEVVAIGSPSSLKVTRLADSDMPFAGSGSRPRFSVLGPNPKSSDRSGQNDSMSMRAAGYARSQGDDRANRWSGGREGIALGRGASQAWETLPCAPASGASSAGPDDFTRSMSRSRQGGQEGNKVTASEKGQVRPTEWSQQSQKRVQGSQGVKGGARGEAALAIAGKSLVTREASSRLSPFAPAIVHRRFLVLEVTYAFRQREKVLIVIEQLPPGWTVVDGDSLEQRAQAGGSTGAAKERHQISLLGDWFDCDVEPGDVVHVLFPPLDDCDGASSKVDERMTPRHVVVDNASGGFLIVHPDILVSPTKVAETVICARKAVLQSRLASDASKSKAAVLGSLKHELFEAFLLEAVAAARSAASSTARSYAHYSPAGAAAALAWGGQRSVNLLTSQRMAMLVDRIVLSQLEALYGADLDEDTARRELLGISEPILAWHRAFLAKPESSGSISSSRGAHVRSGGFASMGSDEAPAARVSVSRVLATEDDVWSPVLGLKGILDVTVEAVVQPLVGGGASEGRGAGNQAGSPALRMTDGGGTEGSLVMPVEVKTGKRIGDARISHRAQVMLYTLLLRIRYGTQASTSGLLVYTSTEGLHTELVSPAAAELRALILARNRHAAGMAKIGRVGLVTGQVGGRGEQGGAALPPVIRRARDCGKCFQNSECMLYHRAVEGGDEESSGLERGAFDGMVGHLSESHLDFFAHWDRTIDLEAKIGEQVRRTMWQESGPERESRTNKCMSDLVWLGEREKESSASGAATNVKPEGGKGSKRFVHVFCREWATPDILRGKTPAPSQAKATSERQAESAPRGVNSRPEWVKSLTDLSLSVGDMVCVSAQASRSRGASWGGRRFGESWIREADHVRLLTGNISAVFEDRVEVSSDKRMRVPRRGGRWSGNPGPRGAGGAGAGDVLDIEDLLGSEREGTGSGISEGRVLFRIDKDEWAASISMMRSNLIKLMAGPSPESEVAARDAKDGGDSLGDEKRRRLIVDLEAPRFGRFTGLLDVPGTLLGWSNEPRAAEAERELEVMFRSALNEDQRSAVRKVVTAKDYALLLGMPGTGKTWTISFAVRVLLARGASVLITSYTHSAVDNLLLKLIKEGVPCLRVGKPSSVHPGVRECCINHDGSAKTTAAYSELVASARVVGCTCLGVKHPLFSRRRFDYCIVDEAGQISQPVVLASLRCADVFVLVGDHYQLPPLVTSSEALEAGMSESLFRRLCEAHPASLQRLSYQYRMNADVMALCNDMTYSGRLRCGNARVEHQRLMIPNLAAVPTPQSPLASCGRTPPCNVSRQGQLVERSRMRPWLTEVLDPARRVIFLDTDAIALDMTEGVPAGGGGIMARSFAGLEARSAVPENGSVGALVNAVECDVVCLLVWGLEIAGFDVGGVGTISPYRSQVQLLQVRLKSSYPSLEINTIDKYQGRDKEVIIVSFVRSNAEGTVGHLLRDWRRLNVALSRAKRKLVLIGSLRTLSGCAILSSLARILETRGWVYSLPRGANRMYPKGLVDPKNTENRQDAGDFGGLVIAAEEASAGSGRQSSRHFLGNLGRDVRSGVSTVATGVTAPFSRGKGSSGGSAEATFARVTRMRQRSAD